MALMLDNINLQSVRGINLEDIKMLDLDTPAPIASSVCGSAIISSDTGVDYGYIVSASIPSWATFAEIDMYWDDNTAYNMFLVFQVWTYDGMHSTTYVQNYYTYWAYNSSGNDHAFLSNNHLRKTLPITGDSINVEFTFDRQWNSYGYRTGLNYKITFFN